MSVTAVIQRFITLKIEWEKRTRTFLYEPFLQLHFWFLNYILTHKPIKSFSDLKKVPALSVELLKQLNTKGRLFRI